MTDKEFDRLKRQIEKTINWLETLQEIYQRETGKRYVRPLRTAAKKTTG